MLKFINDTDEEIQIALPPKEGEDPVKIALAPDEEYTFEDDVANMFIVSDTQPEEPEGETEASEDDKTDEQAEEKTEEKTTEEVAETTSEADDSSAKEEVAKAVAETEAKFAEEKAALMRERRALMSEKAEAKFNTLVREGRAMPSQKKAYMALSLHEDPVVVAEGKTESVSSLLNQLMESAPAARSLYEEEGADGEKEKKAELTPEEKEVAERLGVSEEELLSHKEK